MTVKVNVLTGTVDTDTVVRDQQGHEEDIAAGTAYVQTTYIMDGRVNKYVVTEYDDGLTTDHTLLGESPEPVGLEFVDAEAMREHVRVLTGKYDWE